MDATDEKRARRQMLVEWDERGHPSFDIGEGVLPEWLAGALKWLDRYNTIGMDTDIVGKIRAAVDKERGDVARQAGQRIMDGGGLAAPQDGRRIVPGRFVPPRK